MKRKDFLSYLLLGILLAAAITFIWNYRTTLPWIKGKASAVLNPLLGGLAIGFILNIPASFIDRHLKRSRCMIVSRHSMAIAILIAIIVLSIFLGIVITMVLPELINAITIFVDSLRDFAADSHFWNELDITHILVLKSLVDSADTGIITLADAIDRKLDEFTPSIISFTLSTIVSLISDTVLFIVSFVVAIYFISNKERLKRHIQKLLALIFKPSTIGCIDHVAAVSCTAFSRFITAQVTEAAIIGGLCFVGMLIFRFPYEVYLRAVPHDAPGPRIDALARLRSLQTAIESGMVPDVDVAWQAHEVTQVPNLYRTEPSGAEVYMLTAVLTYAERS